jgi:hypothetical protein
MKKLINLFISILSFIFGIYFIYLCVVNIDRMGWSIFSPEAQLSTPRHPTGEDFSQLILSLMCGLVGIVSGIGYLWMCLQKENIEE